MTAIKEYYNKYSNVINSCLISALIIDYILCVIFGYNDFVKGSLIIPLGQVFQIPLTYEITCYVFVALLLLITVAGLIFKSKLLSTVPLMYTALLVITLVFLFLFFGEGFANETLYNTVYYILIFMLTPLYCIIVDLGQLFLWLFGAFIVLSICTFVVAFKKHND